MANIKPLVGVHVKETDLTTYVVQAASSTAAFAGSFVWGPTNYPLGIQSESMLVEQFGKPTNDPEIYNSFYSSKNFLDYSASLLLVRAEKAGHNNASVDGLTIKVGNLNDYEMNHQEGGNSTGEFAAKYPGEIGNSLKVSMCDALSWKRSVTGTISVKNGSTAVVGSGTNFDDEIAVGDVLAFTLNGNEVEASVASITSPTALVLKEALDFNDSFVVATGSAVVAKKQVGTISVSAASTAVVGVGTNFDGTLIAGDKISVIVGGVEQVRIVDVVTDDNNLTVTAAFTVTATGTDFWKNTDLVGTITATSGSSILAGVGTSFTTALAVSDEIRSTLSNGDVLRSVVSTITNNTAVVVAQEISLSVTSLVAEANWEYAYRFDTAPMDSNEALAIGASADGMHIVVVDENGAFTGTQGQILEEFGNVFKSKNSTRFDGSSGYYATVLKNSNYIWWMDHPTNTVGTGLDFGDLPAPGVFKSLAIPFTVSFTGGDDGANITDGELITAFEIFSNDEIYDVSLVITGKVSAAVQKAVISMAENRMDCVAFVSPFDPNDGSVVVGDTPTNIQKLITYYTVNLNVSSSYSFCDSGVKYQYDKYNDIYRWIPMNADMAGLCARTDFVAESWFAPAGYNRGGLKNVIRLGVNPNKGQRNDLFKVGINPVVSFPGQGIVLFGDKTMQARPSAFDAINVRRLFIVLEKSIATAAKYFLFEQNDEITRQLFLNMVNPFLRDIKSRRGIDDFLVDVGPTVNTAQVLNAREFRGNIYVRPVGAIRTIGLNFIATPYGVDFNEYTVA